MGFEDNFLAELDWKRRKTDSTEVEKTGGVFENAKKRAEKFSRENEIKIDDFKDTYGEDVVDNDKNYVSRMEEIFSRESGEQKNNSQYAEIMEAILCEQIELSDWMGPNASTIKTSRFDDIKNGTDFIVEFSSTMNALSHLGIAVDVTFGANSVEEKFKKIKNEIESGKLTEIKYFESQNGQYKGRLRLLPRVVIGVEKPLILKLAKVWMDPSLKKDFGAHPVQITFLEEIREQLQVFGRYAELVGQPDIAKVYERDLLIIEKVFQERNEAARGEHLEEDKVQRSIQYSLDLFGK
jgi:hypothetical protein